LFTQFPEKDEKIALVVLSIDNNYLASTNLFLKYSGLTLLLFEISGDMKKNRIRKEN